MARQSERFGIERPRRRQGLRNVSDKTSVSTRKTVNKRQIAEPEQFEPIIVRSLPKMIFLYPTVIASLIAGIIVNEYPSTVETVAMLFLGLFLINLVVLSFDFPRNAMIALVVAIALVAVTAAWINSERFEVFSATRRFFDWFEPQANHQFYWILTVGMSILFLLVLMIQTKLDYFMLDSMQLVHHRGWMEATERFPAPGMHVEKDIPDVFEFFLLGSGRLILRPVSGPTIILENVLFVNDVEANIRDLLDTMVFEQANTAAHRHVIG